MIHITINWHGIEEFETLLYEKNGYIIFGDAIQAALDKYRCVQISKRDSMYLEKPIIMKSGYRLKLDKEQHIANLPDLRTCMNTEGSRIRITGSPRTSEEERIFMIFLAAVFIC